MDSMLIFMPLLLWLWLWPLLRLLLPPSVNEDALLTLSKLEDPAESNVWESPRECPERHGLAPAAWRAAAASTAEVGDDPRRESSEKRGFLVLLFGSSEDASERASSYPLSR